MNIIVTGGAGYIGSHVCKILKQKSYNPIVVDDLSSGSRALVKFGDFIQCNISNYEKLIEIFKKYKPVAVMNFAGYKTNSESVIKPLEYYNNNFVATNILLKAMIDCDIKNFIFSSSAAIFGIPQNPEILIDESSPKAPATPYGKSKLMVEEVLKDYDSAYSLKSTSLRYFNACGSDPEGEIGEILGSKNIFPSIFAAIKNKTSFIICGADYATKDGTCIRDYIHVCDLANAHILALEKQLETKKSTQINLGNGEGFSVKEIVELAKKITKVDFEIAFGARRAGDPAKLVADATLAKKYLNWDVKYPNIEDAIKHSYKFLKI